MAGKNGFTVQGQTIETIMNTLEGFCLH